MDDKNKNPNAGVSSPSNSDPQSAALDNFVQQSPADSQALSIEAPQPTATFSQPAVTKEPNLFVRLTKRADVILGALLILGSLGLVLTSSSRQSPAVDQSAASRFETTEIPLTDLVTDAAGVTFAAQSVIINGVLQASGGFVITPSSQPSSATSGQLYYDQTSNVLSYYNGTGFVAVNGGVATLQGQSGAVTLVAGDGIAINGTTITNTRAGGGSIQGTAGRIAKFTGTQSVANSLLVESGTTLTFDGDAIVIEGTADDNELSLGVAGLTGDRTITLPNESGTVCLQNSSACGFLSGGSFFAQGGNSFSGTAILGTNDANDLVFRTNTVSRVTIDTSGNTTFNGDVAVNGGDITSSGALNVTPGGTLTVGSSTQTLTLQGGASSSLRATSGASTTILDFQTPTANVTYHIPTATTGSYDLCTTFGNCAGTGGGVTTAGGTTNRVAKFTGTQTIGDSSITDNGSSVTTSVDFVIQGGDATVGVPSTQTGSIAFAHSGSANTGTITQGALTGSRTYTLPDSSGTFCLSSGNCGGGGGGDTLQSAYDAGNSITTTTGRDIDVVLANTATDSNLDVVVADDSTSFVSISRENGVGTNDPAQLLLVDNLDGNRAVPIGIKLQASGGGLTTAIDVSDTDIGNAFSVGDNTILGTTAIIDFTNFDVLGTGNTTIGGTLTVQGTSTTLTGDLSANGTNTLLGDAVTDLLTINAVLQGASPLTFEGGTADANELTLALVDPTTDQTITFPDATGTVCLSTGNCSGTGSSNTLQAAYDAGNTIATSNNRNIAFNLTDQTTDPSFLIDLQCDTSCSTNGRFAVQDDAVDVFTISPAGGAVNFINTTDSTSAFNIEENSGGNIFTVDTTNSRVGINLGSNNTPTLPTNVGGLELRGALRVTDNGSSGWDQFTTPDGSNINAKINVVVQSMTSFGQIMALGLDSASSDSARALSLFDDRAGVHQPTLTVFDPSENSGVGFSWNGSTAAANVQTMDFVNGNTSSILLKSGNVTGGNGSSGDVYAISGSIAGGTGGSTGALFLQSGNGTGTNSSSGSINLDAGSKTGSGTAGAITIGTVNASALTLGRTGLTTNNAGTLTLGQLGTTDTATYLCRNSSNILAACSTTGAGAAFVQGGNTFGATATLGTNDGNDLAFERNNTTIVTVGASNVTLASNIDLLLQGATAYISNPQGQTGSESFGLNAAVSDTNSLAVGNAATAGGDSTAVGSSANAGSEGTALGRSANAGVASVSIGRASSATFADSIALGANSATTAVNQLVIGGSSVQGSNITQAYLGAGVTSVAGAGASVVLQGSGGSGSNVAGASFTLAGGRSTGSADGGAVNFQVSIPGGSGSSLNSLATVGTFSGSNGAFTLQNAADSTTAFRVLNQAGTATVLDVNTTSQRVGINTAAPSSTLQVNQGISTPGTVSNSASSANVTGSSTTFLTTFQPGDSFTISSSGNTCVVQQITSDTALVCTASLAGSSSGSAYTFTPQTRLSTTDSGRTTLNGALYMTNTASARLFNFRNDPADNKLKVGASSVGSTSIGSGSDSNSNYIQVTQFNSGTGGTISSLRVWFDDVDGVSPNFKVAVYSDSSGSPNALLSSATAPATTATADTWNTASLGTTVTLTPNTTYWLGFTTQSGSTSFGHYNGGSTKYQSGFTWGTNFPGTFTVTDTSSDVISVYAPYLTITDISAGDAAFTVDDNNSVIFKPRHNQDETGTGDATFEVQRADGTTMLAVSTLSRYVGVGDSLQVNAVDTGYTFNLYGSGTSGLMHGYRPTSTASEILMTLNSNVGGTDVAKFIVNAGGTVTLAGGQTTDITTASASTATALTMKPGDTTGSNGTGAALTLKGGDESSSTCGTSCTGGGLVLQGGSATGGSGTRNGGSVSIDAGTGNTANGAINIGTNSSATVTIGRTTGGGTTIIQSGTGGVSVGNDGVANTLQIGNTSGAVSQTVNIGNNATASSTHNVNIGSSIAGTVAIQGATTITNRTSGSADTLVVGNSTSTGNIAVFKDNSTTVFSIADGGAATFQNQTDSTTAFRVLNTSGAGSVPQFVIDTTNSRVYVGNPSSDTTGALLVLDTKSNSTDPTGVDGAMYYNSSMSQMRCYFDGRWRFCNDANTLSWGYDFREDFLGLDVSFIGEKGWSEDSSGTLAGYNTEDTDVASRPGQISIDVGTTNTGRDAVYFNTPSGTEPFFFGGGEEIEMAININTLATVAQDYIAKFGLCDVSDANDCIDGAWFEYDRATSANWRIATANNSSRTRTTSSTAVATGWVRLKIVANSSGTQLDYYVNDVNIGNVTTNIPSSSGRGSQPEFLMRKTAGTTQLTIKIDYFQMRNSLTTKR